MTWAATYPTISSGKITTTSDRSFEVHDPLDGQVTVDQTLQFGWWIGGAVHPEATVTVNGYDLEVRPSNTDDGWWYWGPPDLETGPWTLPLNEGDNTLVFEASFRDGTVLSEARTIVYDPSLTKRASALWTPIDTDRRTAQLTVGTSESFDNSDDGMAMRDSAIVEAPIASNAMFDMFPVKYWRLPSADQGPLDLEGLVDLFAFIDDGNCRLCDPNVADGLGPGAECPDRCIWTSWGWDDEYGKYHTGSPMYEGIALFNADGELRQFSQSYSP